MARRSRGGGEAAGRLDEHRDAQRDREHDRKGGGEQRGRAALGKRSGLGTSRPEPAEDRLDQMVVIARLPVAHALKLLARDESRHHADVDGMRSVPQWNWPVSCASDSAIFESLAAESCVCVTSLLVALAAWATRWIDSVISELPLAA